MLFEPLLQYGPMLTKISQTFTLEPLRGVEILGVFIENMPAGADILWPECRDV